MSGTPAWSPAFLRLADDLAGRLISFGLDMNSSLTNVPRFSAGVISSASVRGIGTVADLAFSTLVMQAKPCGSLASEFTLYLRLISRLGLALNFQTFQSLTLCVAELARYKSVSLDLLLSPYQVDLGKSSRSAYENPAYLCWFGRH